MARVIVGRACLLQCGFQLRIRSVSLKASDFEDILSGGSASVAVTAAAFQGSALFALSQSARGHVLADLARLLDCDIHGISNIADPKPGHCSNGTRRGIHRAGYDWLRRESRIECKSAMMMWKHSTKTWGFQFSNVKIACAGVRKDAAFDELILVLYTPRMLYFYRHDGQFQMSAQGKRTETQGHQIFLLSQRGVEDWSDALDIVLSKLDASTNGCCRLLAMPIADPRVSTVLNRRDCVTRHVYSGVPLADLSSTQRGKTIEALARRVDEILHPGAQINPPHVDLSTSDVYRRASHQAEYDWHRDNIRVECKSAQLLWDAYYPRWRFSFAGVKMGMPPIFDELQLGLYTPRGIYVYRHNLAFGLCSNGVATGPIGHSIQIYGPRWETCWFRALTVIFDKLGRSGCVRVAFVQW
ncbi:unnamed protein product [Prorocentrum cordatum]|uniref:Uncharacterized protein n=1 Tax=Prorocentrum cordatum TaxID=2364126 RepID=A0ABN9VDB8_9DINO|nr:unnamed protein product [Polarella glacialis]